MKILEPILGRMKPGVPSGVRSFEPIDLYEDQRYPMPLGKPRTQRLEELALKGQSFPLRLRQDLSRDDTKGITKKEPLAVPYGDHYIDKRLNVNMPVQTYLFPADGSPVYVTFEHAVWILMHNRFGHLIEEVDEKDLRGSVASEEG